MNPLKPIETAPFDTKILLYWSKSKHIEDGVICENENGERTHHCLFDGKMLNDEPDYWMTFPEIS